MLFSVLIGSVHGLSLNALSPELRAQCTEYTIFTLYDKSVIEIVLSRVMVSGVNDNPCCCHTHDRFPGK